MDKLAAVAALALLSGCAIIDSTISVQHEHPTATARLTRQRQISLTTTRSNPEPRQGVKKNGYGSELASVYTDPKPEKLIRDALETELLQAGFTVGENSPGDVSVEIQNFFAEPEVGFFAGDVYAEVDAVVSVKFDNG